MAEARQAILGRLRTALAGQDRREEAVRTRLARPARGTIPARSAGDRAAVMALFERQAAAAAAAVEHVASDAEIPAAIAAFLAEHNLPARLRVAPDERLSAVDWAAQPTLAATFGSARDEDTAALVCAFSGIAETGSLMLHSGDSSPTTLNFLPDTHIVLLDRSRIVGAYEDAWDELRRLGRQGAMPRAVNIVTGPSRTADIEQTILMGAHGPRRLHILIRNDDDETT